MSRERVRQIGHKGGLARWGREEEEEGGESEEEEVRAALTLLFPCVPHLTLHRRLAADVVAAAVAVVVADSRACRASVCVRSATRADLRVGAARRRRKAVRAKAKRARYSSSVASLLYARMPFTHVALQMLRRRRGGGRGRGFAGMSRERVRQIGHKGGMARWGREEEGEGTLLNDLVEFAFHPDTNVQSKARRAGSPRVRRSLAALVAFAVVVAAVALRRCPASACARLPAGADALAPAGSRRRRRRSKKARWKGAVAAAAAVALLACPRRRFAHTLIH